MAHQGITPRRERFQVATANQLGEPSGPSPTFSDVHWHSDIGPSQRKQLACLHGDLQLTIRPGSIVQSASGKNTSSDCSPLSISPANPQNDDGSPALRPVRQNKHERGPEAGSSSLHRHPDKPKKKKSGLTAMQVRQYNRFFSRSALLRQEYDGKFVHSSDIPLSVVFSLLQDVKLPFGLVFRSLAICDAKINGFPIKVHSKGFVFSSCGLQVGSCKFLNLPFCCHDTAYTNNDKTIDCGHDDGVCGRPFVSTEKAGATKRDSLSKKNKGSSRDKIMEKARCELAYALNFAQEMVEPVNSKESMVPRNIIRRKQSYLLASRMDFSDIVRQIFEAETPRILKLRRMRSHHPVPSKVAVVAAAAAADNDDGCAERTARLLSDLIFDAIKSLELCKGQAPLTTPCQPAAPQLNQPPSRPCRTFDFLCLARLVTEMHKYFLILIPAARCSASPSASPSQATATAATTLTPASASQPPPHPPASNPHQTLASNYKVAWISSALAAKHNSANYVNYVNCVNDANNQKNSNNNNNKNTKNNKTTNTIPTNKALLPSFLQNTPNTELNILTTHLAQHESFMAKARWGLNGQRVWICGVPVYDGSAAISADGCRRSRNHRHRRSDGEGESDTGTDGAHARDDKVNVNVNGGDVGNERGQHGKGVRGQQQQQQQEEEKHEEENKEGKQQQQQQKENMWWVLFLLGERLAGCIA